MSTSLMRPQLRLPGESVARFLARAEQAAKIARVLIDACLRNECVRVLIDETEFPFYTEEYFRESPIVRIDYDEAYAIAAIDDAIASRLKLDPGTFWRAAKGTAFPALPLKPRQLELFEK